MESGKKENHPGVVMYASSCAIKTGGSTYSGGVPLKLKVVKTTSTRCPGPAKKMYKHCLVWFAGLWRRGAVKVPFWGPPAREMNVWSHSGKKRRERTIWISKNLNELDSSSTQGGGTMQCKKTLTGNLVTPCKQTFNYNRSKTFREYAKEKLLLNYSRIQQTWTKLITGHTYASLPCIYLYIYERFQLPATMCEIKKDTWVFRAFDWKLINNCCVWTRENGYQENQIK